MKQWTEDAFLSNTIWYHGTRSIYVSSICERVNAEINKGSELDFGYGLYLTPDRDWALEYARNMVRSMEQGITSDIRGGCVIEFSFSPRRDFKTENYRFFEKLDEEFADFVFANRMNYMTPEQVHTYDYIGGPMSDGRQAVDFRLFRYGIIDKEELYRRLLKPTEDWQLMIRSQSLCDGLRISHIYDLGGKEVVR